MYICICVGVTDREIRRCADRGASTMGELQMELGVGTQCGRCQAAAAEILEERTRVCNDLMPQPA